MSQDLINQMLLCFVDGMTADKPIEIQQVSAEGMVHALSFAAENFKDENAAQRDMIMSSICNATLLDNIVVRILPPPLLFLLPIFPIPQHLFPSMTPLFRCGCFYWCFECCISPFLLAGLGFNRVTFCIPPPLHFCLSLGF